MKRKVIGMLLLTVGLTAGAAQAASFLNIPLHNDTAGTISSPTGKDAWHFVITPNNNHSYFVTFYLNLGDGIHTISTYVQNEGQNDNVFVNVPFGYTLTSLSKTNSSADIVWDDKKQEPDKFTLSDFATGTPVPIPGAALLLGSGLAGLGIFRRRK